MKKSIDNKLKPQDEKNHPSREYKEIKFKFLRAQKHFIEHFFALFQHTKLNIQLEKFKGKKEFNLVHQKCSHALIILNTRFNFVAF